MQRGQVQLQGIPFPYTVRERSASVDLMKFDQDVVLMVETWAGVN